MVVERSRASYLIGILGSCSRSRVRIPVIPKIYLFSECRDKNELIRDFNSRTNSLDFRWGLQQLTGWFIHTLRRKRSFYIIIVEAFVSSFLKLCNCESFVRMLTRLPSKNKITQRLKKQRLPNVWGIKIAQFWRRDGSPANWSGPQHSSSTLNNDYYI